MQSQSYYKSDILSIDALRVKSINLSLKEQIKPEIHARMENKEQLTLTLIGTAETCCDRRMRYL
jgi:hypothetical protein